MPLNPPPIQQFIVSNNGYADKIWIQWFNFLYDYIKSAVFPSIQLSGGTGDQGKMTWNTDEETVDIVQNGSVLQVGQEVLYHVKNQTGSTIANGTAVMAVGTLGASGRILIAPMSGTDRNNAKYFLGVATEDIPNGDDGKVTHFGKVRNINTSSWGEGDVLWVSATSDGVLTNVQPEKYQLGMPVAFVINSHHANGTIFVRASSLDEHLFASNRLLSFTVSALPSAANYGSGAMIYVSNESGGAVPAFSDGTNWRRVTDRAIVS